MQGIAARCLEVNTGARNIEHILTRSLLPELSGRLLQRLAEDQTISAAHVGLDPQGRFAYQIN